MQCGFKTGDDRLYLRLPVEVTHVIDDASPLAAWRQPGGLEADASSEVVVVVSRRGGAGRGGAGRGGVGRGGAGRSGAREYWPFVCLDVQS